MLSFADDSPLGSHDLSVTPITFFRDQILLSPEVGTLVVTACNSGPSGCTCGKSGCACFYGAGA